MSHLSITKASLTSAFTFIVGQLVAFVPAFGPDKQGLISAGTSLIAAVFLIANSIHHMADSKNVSTKQVESHAIEVAREELAKVDLNSLAANAVNGNLPDVPAFVRGEIGKALAEVFGQPVTKPAAPEDIAAMAGPVTVAPPVQVYPEAPAPVLPDAPPQL